MSGSGEIKERSKNEREEEASHGSTKSEDGERDTRDEEASQVDECAVENSEDARSHGFEVYRAKKKGLRPTRRVRELRKCDAIRSTIITVLMRSTQHRAGRLRAYDDEGANGIISS